MKDQIVKFFRSGNKRWIILCIVTFFIGAVIGNRISALKPNGGSDPIDNNVIDINNQDTPLGGGDIIDIGGNDTPLGGVDVFTILDFGAVGDGVTDDSAALIKYIQNGSTVLSFPEGTYNLANVQIDFTDHVIIEGDSAENTILLNTNFNAPQGLEIRNIAFGESGGSDLLYAEDPTSILDCGAVGDGITDDSAAFIRYLESGCTTLYIPEGTYNLAHVQIDFPEHISIVGDSADNTTLLNININAPYGLELKNICCDTGTDRTIKCERAALLTANVMFNVMPIGSQNVSYESCIFKNCDYASVAKHYVNDSPNRFESDTVRNCQFYNIGFVAINHVLDIENGEYSGNIFDGIGSVTLTTGQLGALKLGDSTNSSTCELKNGSITNNTFSNLISGDDVTNQKHSMACNFITVQGTTVVIDNNKFENLLGYGDDREAIYTKVRYLTISNNTIINGGFGEGYICNKSRKFADAFAEIKNNTIIGDYGTGIRTYGGANIENNKINIRYGRAAISCLEMDEDSTNMLRIDGNNITFGIGDAMVGGKVMESYKAKYIIQVEHMDCPINISNNTISCTQAEGKIEAAIRAGSVRSNVVVDNNNIYSGISHGILVNANSSFEEVNSDVRVEIKGNEVTCNGQPISIIFLHSSVRSSNRCFEIADNVLSSLTTTDYGVTINSGTGNGDLLLVEGNLSKDGFKKNAIYTSTSNVESSDAALITRKK